MHFWHSRVDEGSKGGRRAWRVSALLPPFRLPLAQSARFVILNAPRRVGVPRAAKRGEAKKTADKSAVFYFFFIIFLRYCPVYERSHSATSSGVPVAIT